MGRERDEAGAGIAVAVAGPARDARPAGLPASRRAEGTGAPCMGTPWTVLRVFDTTVAPVRSRLVPGRDMTGGGRAAALGRRVGQSSAARG